MSFINRTAPSIRAITENNSPHIKADEIVNLVKKAKAYNSNAGKALHYLKLIVTIGIPSLISVIRKLDAGGGSSGAIFREQSIEGNFKQLAQHFSKLPEDFEEFEKGYSIQGAYEQLLFTTTEISVFRAAYGGIVAYENDFFGKPKAGTKQIIFETKTDDSSETKQSKYDKFRNINVQLNRYLNDHVKENLNINSVIYSIRSLLKYGVSKHVIDDAFTMPIEKFPELENKLTQLITKEISTNLKMPLQDNIGVQLDYSGKIFYIGPLENDAPKKTDDVAIFNFNGTQENETSPSIHNEIVKKAVIPDEHKFTYAGPGGSAKCVPFDIVRGGITGQNSVDGVDGPFKLEVH